MQNLMELIEKSTNHAYGFENCGVEMARVNTRKPELKPEGMFHNSPTNIQISCICIQSYHLSFHWVIKSLQKLDRSAFPTATASNKCYCLPFLNTEG